MNTWFSKFCQHLLENHSFNLEGDKKNTAVIFKQMSENEIHFSRLLLITLREKLSYSVTTTSNS